MRLLAQSDGEVLSLHFAEIDADADLILRHVQGDDEMEEPAHAATSVSGGDSQRPSPWYHEMKQSLSDRNVPPVRAEECNTAKTRLGEQYRRGVAGERVQLRQGRFVRGP